MITSTRRIASTAGVVCLVLAVSWYFLLWKPQTHQLSAAHKAKAAAEQQATQLQGQVGSLRALAKKIPQDQAAFAQLEQAIPDNPSLDTALTELHAAELAAGVNLTSVIPTSPSTGQASSGPSSARTSGVPAVTVQMTAAGQPGQVSRFLVALNGMPRVLVIDKLGLSSSSQLTTASISARIFYASATGH